MQTLRVTVHVLTPAETSPSWTETCLRLPEKCSWLPETCWLWAGLRSCRAGATVVQRCSSSPCGQSGVPSQRALLLMHSSPSRHWCWSSLHPTTTTSSVWIQWEWLDSSQELQLHKEGLTTVGKKNQENHAITLENNNHPLTFQAEIKLRIWEIKTCSATALTRFFSLQSASILTFALAIKFRAPNNNETYLMTVFLIGVVTTVVATITKEELADALSVVTREQEARGTRSFTVCTGVVNSPSW